MLASSPPALPPHYTPQGSRSYAPQPSPASAFRSLSRSGQQKRDEGKVLATSPMKAAAREKVNGAVKAHAGKGKGKEVTREHAQSSKDGEVPLEDGRPADDLPDIPLSLDSLDLPHTESTEVDGEQKMGESPDDWLDAEGRPRFVGNSSIRSDADEPILRETDRRFVLFPIKYHEVR